MREKCSKRFFEKNSCFAHFGQKLSKIGHFWPKCPKMVVFCIFLGILSLLFSETLQLVRACKGGKNVPSAFLKKNPVLPILAKNCPKLAIWLDVCNSLFKGWKSLKNLKVGVFETDFKQVPFVFRQTTHTYSESWGPVEKITQKPKFVSKIFPPIFA